MYVSVEFNRCISGNAYRSNVVYNSSDAIFDSLFVELAKSADLETITFTVFHRPRNSKNSQSVHLTEDIDERLGAVVIEAEHFGAWNQWIWCSLDVAPTAFLQFKIQRTPLDVALLRHQNKESQRVDHYIAVHLDGFVPAEDSKMNLVAPSVQIEWEWDDNVFWTQSARRDSNGNDGILKWEQSHFVTASLRTDERMADLKFFVVDDGTVCDFVCFVGC